MTQRRLIEEKLPIKELSVKSKREIGARPPIVEMQFYWARRPLIACRAAIVGSILTPSTTIQEFREIIKLNAQDPYRYAPDGLLGKKLKILDPFSGRGSIPFEALRTGAETYSSDLNPVSYLIQKCTMEYPIKWGERLAQDVKKWGKWIIDRLKEDLGHLFSDDVRAYMYVWHIKCVDCGRWTPILKNWTISPKRNISFQLTNEKLKIVKDFQNKSKGNYSDGKAVCAFCNATIRDTTIKSELSRFLNEDGKTMFPKLVSVILETPKGKEFVEPREKDIQKTRQTEKTLKEEWVQLTKEDLIPIEEIAPYQSRGLPIVLYGYKYWYQLYNPRHLLFGAHLIRWLRKAREMIERETKDSEYAKAVSSYFLLMLDKYADINTRSNSLTDDSVKHTMAFRGAIFTTDFYEPNPFAKVSGSLLTVLKDIVEGLEFSIESLAGKQIPNIQMASALTLPHESEYFDLIVTDPPYENDVFYTELSDLMYVWIKRATNDYPDIFKYTTLWQELSQEEASNNPQRFLSSEKRMKVASEHYHELMLSCFVEINRVLKSDGILAVFFSHSSTKAWSRLVNVLMGSGFKIISSWPVHTEMTQRPTGTGKEVIDTSIIVVARKRNTDEIGYLERLRPTALAKVRAFVKHILNEQPDISWADLVNAGMGPAMEIISAYKEVKSMKGKLIIDDLLDEISQVVTRVILEKLLGGNINIDSPTALYILLNTSRNGSKKDKRENTKTYPSDYISRLCISLSIELAQVKQYSILAESTVKKKVIFKLVSPTAKELSAFMQQRKLTIDRIPDRELCLIDIVHMMEYAFAVRGKIGLEQLSQNILPEMLDSAVEIMRALYSSLPPNDDERELIRPILGTDADYRGGKMDSFF